MKTSPSSLNVAAALAGAIALASLAAPAQAEPATGLEKCYGISKAGENSCANGAGTHSCAGHSKVDYDGGEWRAVKAGMCVEMGGSLTAFQGVNPKKKA